MTWPPASENNSQRSLGMTNKSTDRIVLSELPDTTSLSWYWRQAMPRLCPLIVRTNSHVLVHQTLIVRSPEADTMYRLSKSTTLTAARWPTRTRRNEISVGLWMSQTAIDRSFWEKCNNIFEIQEWFRVFGSQITVNSGKISTHTDTQ